jgi:hypothetical protein
MFIEVTVVGDASEHKEIINLDLVRRIAGTEEGTRVYFEGNGPTAILLLRDSYEKLRSVSTPNLGEAPAPARPTRRKSAASK